jgi:hypothetical protein
MSWTDAGKESVPPEPAPGPDLPLLALQGRRQIAHLVERLGQQGRGPTPRRPPRARAARRTLPAGNPGLLLATWRCWHAHTVLACVP